MTTKTQSIRIRHSHGIVAANQTSYMVAYPGSNSSTGISSSPWIIAPVHVCIHYVCPVNSVQLICCSNSRLHTTVVKSAVHIGAAVYSQTIPIKGTWHFRPGVVCVWTRVQRKVVFLINHLFLYMHLNIEIISTIFQKISFSEKNFCSVFLQTAKKLKTYFDTFVWQWHCKKISIF